MTVNERFGKVIRTLYGGNKSAFANAIGVTPSVVDNIVGRRQGNPSFEVLKKVSAIAEVNIDWLVTGRGEPFDFSKSKEFEDRKVPAEKPPSTNNMIDKLLAIVQDKDRIIREQAEEIGQLRERISTMERRKGENASNARSSDIANVG